jgi:beta-lactamase regulating signal transducer with metallopeptidase domain
VIASFPIDCSALVAPTGWMLLHSLWQGAGIAMALAIALRVLRLAPARARYLAACLAMCLLITTPAASVRWLKIIPAVVSSPRLVDRDEVALRIVAQRVAPTPAIPPVATRLADRLQPFLPAIVVLWMAGVGVFALRLLGGWVQVRRWLRASTRQPAAAWLDRLDRLKERMNLGRGVRLLESACIEVPMVVGWLRPAILVPVAALSGLSAAELDSILAHELAHIRRHDYLVNLLQCVVEALLFYHPATWWISRVIRREREHCCDDVAVAVCRDRLVYARALAAMEGLRAPALALSPAANGGILFARIRRILNPQEESMKPVRMLVGLAMALAVVSVLLARADDLSPRIVPPGPATITLPNHSFADVLTQVDESPTGRRVVLFYDRPVGKAKPPRTSSSLAESQPDCATANKMAVLSQDDPGCLDPPSEAEVWAKVCELKRDRPPFYEIQRNNLRIQIEKIADKVDPCRVYPLAGPCELVHCHYKCTVSYDELFWSDYPIPFHHVERKVKVVYIEKDHLRRASEPDPRAKSRDDRLDQISREVEELKRVRRLDREDEDRIINRLIQQLEALKRHLADGHEG